MTCARNIYSTSMSTPSAPGGYGAFRYIGALDGFGTVFEFEHLVVSHPSLSSHANSNKKSYRCGSESSDGRHRRWRTCVSEAKGSGSLWKHSVVICKRTKPFHFLCLRTLQQHCCDLKGIWQAAACTPSVSLSPNGHRRNCQPPPSARALMSTCDCRR